MCGSGGGAGGSGTQKYEWNDTLGRHWVNALDYAEALKDQKSGGYKRYPGERIAQFQGDQKDAMKQISETAWRPSADVTAARDQATRTLQGGYLGANPAANASNPWAGISANLGKNEYMGEGEAFKGVLDRGLRDLGEKYQHYTAPQLNAQAVLNGTLGGGDHLKAQAANEQNLARQMSDFTSGMLNDQYNRSASLREADISRDLQDQQFDKQLGGQWFNQDKDRSSQAWMNERGNMMQGIGLGQAGQGLDFQRWGQLMGIGDAQQQREQQVLDLLYGNWTDENNHALNLLDQYTGFLSRAQGGMAPNVTTSGFTPRANPVSQFLGAGMFAKGMGMF